MIQKAAEQVLVRALLKVQRAEAEQVLVRALLKVQKAAAEAEAEQVPVRGLLKLLSQPLRLVCSFLSSKHMPPKKI